MAKEFSLAAVLSITTGSLLTSVDDLYEITGYLISDNGVTTLGLLAVHEQCKEGLLKQFPELKEIDTSHINRDNWKVELGKFITQYGPSRNVLSLAEIGTPCEQRTIADDIALVKQINPNVEVIVVATDNV